MENDFYLFIYFDKKLRLHLFSQGTFLNYQAVQVQTATQIFANNLVNSLHHYLSLDLSSHHRCLLLFSPLSLSLFCSPSFLSFLLMLSFSFLKYVDVCYTFTFLNIFVYIYVIVLLF